MSAAKKRLTELERLEIINQLERKNPPSKRYLGRSFNVSEGAIRKIWQNRDEIKRRSADMSEQRKSKKLRFSSAKYPELESQLYDWISVIRKANLPISPSIIIARANEIANNLSLEDFKASWMWFSRFRDWKELQGVYLHGEGGEVNKEDPALLEKLNKLYDEIITYDADRIYNMDETGIVFRMIPNYTYILPNEDVKTARGRKKAKERVSLIVCSNATGSHKLQCSMIGKPKAPACIKGRR